MTGSSLLRTLPSNDAPVWLVAPSATAVEDVELTLDLSLLAFDEETPAGELVFTSDSPYSTVSGPWLTLLYPEGVLSDRVSLTASDGALSSSVTLQVAVTPVNDLPTLIGDPPADLQPNSTASFQFGAADAEVPLSVTFRLSSPVSWISLTASGLLTLSPPASTHGHFEYSVSVVDGQGGEGTRSFLVGVGNRAPVIGAIPRNATTDQWYVVTLPVSDPDGDPLNVSMSAQDPSIVFDPETYQVRWIPVYPHPPGTPFEVDVDITFRASDGIAEVFRTFTVIVRDPPNRPPQITRNFAVVEGPANGTVPLDLTQYTADYTFDPDDPPANLTWHVAGGLDGAVATWLFDPATQVLTITFREPGDGNLTLYVEDPSGRISNTTSLHVRTLSPAVAPLADPTEFPWWWWWLAVVLGLAGVGAAVAARRRLGREPGLAERPAARVAPAAPSHARQPFLVEDVLLLSRGGRPIYSRGADADGADSDVVGSMLVAVQEFVRDAFRAGSPVSQMSYGDNAILLEWGEHVILAVSVFGNPAPALRELMNEVVGKVERAFAGVIGTWDGDRATLAGLGDLLAPLWLGSAKLTRADVEVAMRGADVQMLSAIEFFQGYVRVRVALVNNTPSVINRAIVNLDYNADVLRLVRIEPAAYKSADARVVIGSVGRGERVSIAYYLDPQLCTTSWIDGSCVYRDTSGEQHALEMKSRRAEVVCPIFFTREQANSAMLKRLIETELNLYDARGYRFREGASPEELRAIFDTMKSAVLAHDVQLVRTFERRRPYFAEGWFYGRTQAKGYQMVIRAAVNPAKGRAEFFVASTAMPPITGLLAELHHTFQEAAGDRLAALRIEPLFDEQLRGEYTDRAELARGEGSGAEPGGDAEPR